MPAFAGLVRVGVTDTFRAPGELCQYGYVEASGLDTTYMIVGIDQYDHRPELAGVRRDIAVMARLLDDMGFERLQAHLDTTCSMQDLRQALDNWMRKPATKSVIYWAGHAGVNGVFYLLVKTSPDELLDLSPATALGAHDLAPFTAASRTKETLLILDVCYAGGAATTIIKDLWDILDQGTQVGHRAQILGSARAQEPAHDEGQVEFVQRIDRLLRLGRAPSVGLWTQNDESVSVEGLFRALEVRSRLVRLGGLSRRVVIP